MLDLVPLFSPCWQSDILPDSHVCLSGLGLDSLLQVGESQEAGARLYANGQGFVAMKARCGNFSIVCQPCTHCTNPVSTVPTLLPLYQPRCGIFGIVL